MTTEKQTSEIFEILLLPEFKRQALRNCMGIAAYTKIQFPEEKNLIDIISRTALIYNIGLELLNNILVTCPFPELQDKLKQHVIDTLYPAVPEDNTKIEDIL